MKSKIISAVLAFVCSSALWVLIFFAFKRLHIADLSWTTLAHSEVSFISYFLLSYFILRGFARKSNPQFLLGIMIVACIGFLLPYSLTHMPFQSIGFLRLLSYLLGIVGGYAFYLAQKPQKIVILALSVLYCLLLALFVNSIVAIFIQGVIKYSEGLM